MNFVRKRIGPVNNLSLIEQLAMWFLKTFRRDFRVAADVAWEFSWEEKSKSWMSPERSFMSCKSLADVPWCSCEKSSTSFVTWLILGCR